MQPLLAQALPGGTVMGQSNKGSTSQGAQEKGMAVILTEPPAVKEAGCLGCARRQALNSSSC